MASSDSDPGRRPRVGLTTYVETASWGAWTRPAAIVPQVYLHAVGAAGGVPVLLPQVAPEHGGTDASVLDAVDGLVVIGGADVDPAGYAADAHPATAATRPERDHHEMVLLRAALRRDMPVLGVCRGAQLLTVAYAGTLHQHLPDLLGHDHHQPAPATFGDVKVTTEPDSHVASILGAATSVPCYHHQGLADVRAPLRPVAWAGDGLVEAVEVPLPAWVVGVQWHPEENRDDLRLFEAHVSACARPRGAR